MHLSSFAIPALQAEYRVGGGIVWDSSGDDEYNEALLKARVLNERQNEFSLIETMRWTREEGYFLQKKHIRRLSDSAEYFGFTFSKKGLKDLLDEMDLAFSSPQRVRISLDHSGEYTVEAQELLQAETQTFKVCLAEKPVSARNVFLFHKTTRLEDYSEISSSQGRGNYSPLPLPVDCWPAPFESICLSQDK